MQTKNEYRNNSQGVCGVVVIDPDGKPKGMPVQPGESVWLSEDERIHTANAPRSDEDNPLNNGTLILVTPAAEIKNRRPIGDDELAPGEPKPESQPQSQPTPEESQKQAIEEMSDSDKAAKAEAAKRDAREKQAQKQAAQPGKPLDETGAAVEPKGLPHQGQRAPQEEVATPAAPAKAGAEK